MVEGTRGFAGAHRVAVAGFIAWASCQLGCTTTDCEALPEPRAFVLLEEDDAEAAVSTEGECEQPRCDSAGETETACFGWSFRLSAYSAECALGITFADGSEAAITLLGSESDDCGHLFVNVGHE